MFFYSSLFFFKFILFIYLFLAELSLHCCVWAFSSSVERGLISRCSAQANLCCGFSRCGTQAIGHVGSVVVLHGLVALQYVESSWTREQTHVPCIGRQRLNHWTTKEVYHHSFSLQLYHITSLLFCDENIEGLVS